MGFIAWEAARRCTDGPQPGAVALMDWALANYGDRGAYNLGIYNCRTVRGSGTRSLHSEGRALDIGLPMDGDGTGTAMGHRLVDRLREVGEDIGIQCMIYDRRIWSAKSPGPDGRPYTGASPHYNHIHLELGWRAARQLDEERITQVIGGTPARRPSSIDYERYNRTAEPGERLLRLGSAGNDVQVVQSHIGRERCGEADGYYGPKTESGVRWYQDMRGIMSDGVVGSETWSQVLGRMPAPRSQPVGT